MVPTGADGAVTCVYTSVSRLPIHYTLPYVEGSETLALASSTDGGRVWVRDPDNPILLGPPPGVDVTGWRDPYVAPWPALDALLREEQQHLEQQKAAATEEPSTAAPLYGLLSGGIRGASPAVFLYQVDSNALGRWQYLGALKGPGCLNHNPSPRWTGDFGRNWEVCNFFSLAVPGGVGVDAAAAVASREFLLCGVEGRLADPRELAAKGEFRATHAQMWMCGRLGAARGGSGVDLEYRYGGMLDHGAFYAGNSFWDPRTRQQVVFGWVLEEDLSLELRRAQGWAGVITLPRVLRVAVLRSVVGALVSPLRSIGCVELIPEDSAESRFTVVTLCAVPDARLRKLRGVRMNLPEKSVSHRADGCYSLDFPQPYAQWEMRLLFAVGPDASRLGFDIIHSPSTQNPQKGEQVDDANHLVAGEKTTVYFDPTSEEIMADRSKSSSVPGVRRFTESAPHTLFTFAGPNDSTTSRDGAPQTRQEVLDFHVFYDTSVLEIFVNERTALTTRVYPTSGTSSQIRPFVDTCGRASVGGSGSRLVDIKIWPLSL